ncbi:restriction endonuclease subunit S [Maribacter dokdonensis]|uniref:restriction endonuclease subunit S n=1 Tax=Maribacter dokdonensis TaxID=320912 RepID=UPI001B323FD6|nr:restriction endonuclease subunit S [Maribacter dokdonensis]
MQEGKTKQSAQLKTQPLIPKLRFKEFDGEWKKKKLGEISKIERGKFSPRPRNNPIYYNGSIPFVQTSDVVNSKGKILSYSQTLNEKGLAVSKRFKKGSILITIAANIGYAGVLQIDMACPDSLIGLSCKENVYNYFLNYLLQIEQPKMDYLAVAAAQKNINIEFLKPYLFNIPSLPEQHKIASFLSAVDEKIQQLTQKKSLLEQYKKGVMQQLFSGELRFKDENGENFPDWEEKRFNDLYSFHSTNSFSRDKLNYVTGSVYNIHYGDIHTKFKTAFKLNEEYVPFVNNDVDLLKIKADSYCKRGDLVMADASEDYADIGKTIELMDLNDKNVLAGLHTFLARPTTSKTTIGFVGVLLKSWGMRKQIMFIAQGTKVLSLSTTRVGKLKLKLPVVEEQQKIADYLSAIDTKIETVNQQIEKTQAFKKGLLQQMFV